MLLRTPLGRLNRLLWEPAETPVPRSKRLGLRAARTTYAVVGDVLQGQLTLRAMSLVYTTLLSLIPLLAVSFSVLKGFGVHNQMEPLLANLLAPLGERGGEVTTQIIGFVENMNVSVLGGVGLAVLFYTVISLLQKVEDAFNFIWGVGSARALSRRFSDYLSVIVVGPVLVFSALGLTASVMNNAVVQDLLAIEPFGTLLVIGTRLVPYLLIIAAFTFVYAFVPNARIRLVPALIGGVIAGILWQSTGWIFASFVASSGRYAAIYSSFAILILFLIWLYLAWLILLLGADFAYYVQNPHRARPEGRNLRLSNALRERLALSLMYWVTRAYLRARPPVTQDTLARLLDSPSDAVAMLLEDLRKQRLLTSTSDEPPAWLPARDPATIRLSELYGAIRQIPVEQVSRNYDRTAPVNEVLAYIEAAWTEALNQATLKDLALQSAERPARTDDHAEPDGHSQAAPRTPLESP